MMNQTQEVTQKKTRTLSASHKAKISAANKGKNLGIKRNPITRFRMQQALKKTIYQYSRDGKELLAVYGSLLEAAAATGVCYSNISATCSGKVEHAGGYKWSYEVPLVKKDERGKQWTVYVMKNIVNGKLYFGCTSTPEERMKYHFWFATHPESADKPLYDDIRQYGQGSFKFSVLSTHSEKAIALAQERFFISLFNTWTQGYNQPQGQH